MGCCHPEEHRLTGDEGSAGRASRTEHDLLGARELPAASLTGIHALRARENFRIAARPGHPELVRAFGLVKLACLRTNRALGCAGADAAALDALEAACLELAEGALGEHVDTDALAGGAGTSLNMAVNEVLANRALVLLGEAPGSGRVDPLRDVNRHQSTNDTYPTALRVAAIRGVRRLEASVVRLQESFQAAEKRLAHVVKVGRTEMQDAVLTTLGRAMGAYAEALSRDRWRLYKCEERLRVVNLGGTAIGTGLGAPRAYVFRATDTLRQLTGLGLARAENLVEATQNADVFVEVSGLLKALAATLLKISGDLRLLSSGPEAGLGELRLPPRQAGSSHMPGKVNPVIPEAASQAAMAVYGHDAAIGLACASGSLELNPFLPLVADALLASLDLLERACDSLARLCVDGLEADEERCAAHVRSSTAVVTALAPALGYDAASALARAAAASRRAAAELAVERGLLSAEQVAALTAPEAVCRLGGTPEKRS